MSLRKQELDQAVIALYDRFTHGEIPRREFMGKMASVLGSSLAVTSALGLLQNNYAQAAQVAETDARLDSSQVTFGRLDNHALNGYLVWPKGSKNLPAVIVIHENRGLNPHIKDVARKLALSGFLVLAPDYLSVQGGTPADEDAARDGIGKLPGSEALSTSQMAVSWLQEQGNGKVGCVGFCWGGGQAAALASRSPELKAAVSYYGAQPPVAQVPDIQAALMLHYAGLDERINAGIDRFEMALQAHRKTYELYRYAGVNHAFNNDTNAARYDKAAADLAWQRTVDFLKLHLR